jgi:predicted RNase H-like nuclease (RuvC/YqgF family)
MTEMKELKTRLRAMIALAVHPLKRRVIKVEGTVFDHEADLRNLKAVVRELEAIIRELEATLRDLKAELKKHALGHP